MSGLSDTGDYQDKDLRLYRVRVPSEEAEELTEPEPGLHVRRKSGLYTEVRCRSWVPPGSPLERSSAGSFWGTLAHISSAWGSSFLFVKLISGSLAPFTFAASRGFIAWPPYWWWLTLRRGALGDAPHGVALSLAEFRHMAVLGTTNGWFANVMMVVAVKYAPSSTVALVQTAVPLMVAALAHFLFPRERLLPVQWLGVFARLAGFVSFRKADIARPFPLARRPLRGHLRIGWRAGCRCRDSA